MNDASQKCSRLPALVGPGLFAISLVVILYAIYSRFAFGFFISESMRREGLTPEQRQSVGSTLDWILDIYFWLVIATSVLCAASGWYLVSRFRKEKKPCK